jgi:hypothetical protein
MTEGSRTQWRISAAMRTPTAESKFNSKLAGIEHNYFGMSETNPGTERDKAGMRRLTTDGASLLAFIPSGENSLIILRRIQVPENGG